MGPLAGAKKQKTQKINRRAENSRVAVGFEMQFRTKRKAVAQKFLNNLAEFF